MYIYVCVCVSHLLYPISPLISQLAFTILLCL